MKTAILESLIQVFLQVFMCAKYHPSRQVYARFRCAKESTPKFYECAEACAFNYMFHMANLELFLPSFWIRGICVAQ